MFSIDERNNIKLTRGNSCKIDILPIITSSKTITVGTPEILEEGDKLIFTIASPSGRKYLQKILTSDDYDENDDSVNLVLFPEDTIDLQPFDYVYDAVIVYDNGMTVTFIDNATFTILPAVGTYKDLERG